MFRKIKCFFLHFFRWEEHGSEFFGHAYCPICKAVGQKWCRDCTDEVESIKKRPVKKNLADDSEAENL